MVRDGSLTVTFGSSNLTPYKRARHDPGRTGEDREEGRGRHPPPATRGPRAAPRPARSVGATQEEAVCGGGGVT